MGCGGGEQRDNIVLVYRIKVIFNPYKHGLHVGFCVCSIGLLVLGKKILQGYKEGQWTGGPSVFLLLLWSFFVVVSPASSPLA